MLYYKHNEEVPFDRAWNKGFSRLGILPVQAKELQMKDSYNIGLQELEDKAQEFIRLMYGMAERQLLESTHTPPTARESALASAAQAAHEAIATFIAISRIQ